MSFFEDLFCPVCDEDHVPAYGDEESPILIVGAKPGDYEIKTGIPMGGAMGGVLRSEFRWLGYDLDKFRRTNLWLHEPNKNEGCFNHGVQEVIKEAKNKKAIIMMGAEPVQYFFSKPVTDVCGLFLTTPLLSCKIIIVSVNPAIVFQENSTVGEMKLVFQKFFDRCKKEGIL